MLFVGASGLYTIITRWILPASPEERNKLGYLIGAIAFLAVFGFASVTPLAHDVPIGHIGALVAASILTLATVREDLISINAFLRRLLGWASIIAIGITVLEILLLAGHFGKTQPQAYTLNTYSLVHRLASFLGAVAFMVAGVAGVLYLMSDHNLRQNKRRGHHLPPKPGVFGSLERLEHLTYTSVTLGFALFTLGLITGAIWLHEDGSRRMGPHWYLSPKVIFSLAAWAVFAVVLHTPIAPRLRGRKNAVLSIIGVALTLASIVAVLLMPAGGAQ
jgi:ABC-type uncharacterized transport system permease subunit